MRDVFTSFKNIKNICRPYTKTNKTILVYIFWSLKRKINPIQQFHGAVADLYISSALKKRPDEGIFVDIVLCNHLDLFDAFLPWFICKSSIFLIRHRMAEAQPPLRPNTLCSTFTKAGSWSWTNTVLTCALDYAREGVELELKHWWLTPFCPGGSGWLMSLRKERGAATFWRLKFT